MYIMYILWKFIVSSATALECSSLFSQFLFPFHCTLCLFLFILNMEIFSFHYSVPFLKPFWELNMLTNNWILSFYFISIHFSFLFYFFLYKLYWMFLSITLRFLRLSKINAISRYLQFSHFVILFSPILHLFQSPVAGENGNIYIFSISLSTAVEL